MRAGEGLFFLKEPGVTTPLRMPAWLVVTSQILKNILENIVEVFLRAPLPFLPQPGKVVLNLEHKLQLVDNQSRRVKITLVQVTARNQGGPARQLRLPPLKIPVLEALSSQGAGIFETTYCDDMLRITRGDRGEIRIFTKA